MIAKKLKTIGLIPSRLESSRLPQKALVDICGLPMVVHVYKRAKMANMLDDVYVVTDNQLIAQAVEKHGGKAIMTRSDHQTGTDRIAEAAEKIDADIIVNIQGDEALLDPEHINKVVKALHDDNTVNVGLLVTPYNKRNSPSDIKAVLKMNNDIMYLSREDIPSDSRTKNAPMLKAYHIVPFRRDFLFKYSSLEKTHLEKIEFNEYLRILENGFNIRAVHVDSSAISVDTFEDLEYVRQEMMNDKFFPKYKI